MTENIDVPGVGDKREIATHHDCFAIQFKGQPFRGASRTRMKRFQCRRQSVSIVLCSLITDVEINGTERSALGNGGCQANNHKLHLILNQASKYAVEFQWHAASLVQKRYSAKPSPTVPSVSGVAPR